MWNKKSFQTLVFVAIIDNGRGRHWIVTNILVS
jgi:hypothetical protein